MNSSRAAPRSARWRSACASCTSDGQQLSLRPRHRPLLRQGHCHARDPPRHRLHHGRLHRPQAGAARHDRRARWCIKVSLTLRQRPTCRVCRPQAPFRHRRRCGMPVRRRRPCTMPASGSGWWRRSSTRSRSGSSGRSSCWFFPPSHGARCPRTPTSRPGSTYANSLISPRQMIVYARSCGPISRSRKARRRRRRWASG